MTDEEVERILRKEKNIVKLSGANFIQTKKKVNQIEQEVIELHKKMILLL